MDSNTIQKLIDLINKSDADGKEELINKLNNLNTESKQSIEDASGALEKYKNSLKANVIELERQMKAQEESNNLFLEGAEKRLKILRDMGATHTEEFQLIAAKIEQRKEEIALQQQQNAGTKLVIQSMDGYMKRLGLGKDLSDSFVGQLLLSGPQGFSAIAASLKDALQPQALFASGLAQMTSATTDLFWRLDDAVSGLNKATGATGEYNDMVYDMQESNKAFNVTVKESAEAVGALHKQYAGFTSLGKEAQQQIATTTARMQAFGGSIQGTAQNFDILIEGMSMTTAQADAAQMDLLALSKSIGVGFEQIEKGFAESAPELAKYGQNAVEVFKGVAAAAKATGIEISKLMGITKQFDTFEGAAQGAAKLNAVLGGGVINSMELLNANEEERIRLLIKSVDASGKSWENMNKFERQMVANAAGISDMTEANKLFTMSLSEYDKMQTQAAQGDMNAEEMERRAQAAQSFSEKLDRIKEAFAIGFMPILEGLRAAADWIIHMNDVTGGMFIPTMVALLGVFALLLNAQKIMNVVTGIGMGLRSAYALITGGLSTAQGVLAGTTTMTGIAETKAIVPTAGLTTAFAGMATVVLPLTPAIAGLGFAFGGLGLAIAAPFLAFTAMLIVLYKVFKLTLQMPEALGAAVAGVIMFAVATAAAMMIIAVGITGAAMIMAPFAPMIMVAAEALGAFGMAMIKVVAPLILAAYGLKVLGIALREWAEVEIGMILKAAFGLWVFAKTMVLVAVPLGAAGLSVGLAALALGFGLQILADGITAFSDIGMGLMISVAASLVAFGWILIAGAVPLTLAGILVGISLIPLGLGLLIFAKGIKEYAKVAEEIDIIGTLWELAIGLLGFALAFIWIAKPVGIVSAIIGGSLLLIGFGLKIFAKSLVEFDNIGNIDEILSRATSAIAWAASHLLMAAPGIFLAGILVGIPLMLLAFGLKQFAIAMDEFAYLGSESIPNATAALQFLVDNIGMGLAIKIFMLGLLVAVPLIMFALGLKYFAEGLQEFNRIGNSEIETMVYGLTYLADEIGYLGSLKLAVVFGAISIPLYLFAMGLLKFAEALYEFNYITGTEVDKAVNGLMGFLTKIGAQEALVGMIMGAVGYPLYYFAVGLWAFGIALQKFNNLSQDEIDLAISSLSQFLWSVEDLPISLYMGFALSSLGWGMISLAEGLNEVAGNEDTMIALGQFMSGLGAMANVSTLSLLGIAYGIHKIVDAVEDMPSRKGIAFQATMNGIVPAIEAAQNLTPETVELTKEFVGDQIALLRARTQAVKAEAQAALMGAIFKPFSDMFGGGDDKGGAGTKEVVLQLNEREFGRAVINAVEGQYSTKTE